MLPIAFDNALVFKMLLTCSGIEGGGVQLHHDPSVSMTVSRTAKLVKHHRFDHHFASVYRSQIGQLQWNDYLRAFASMMARKADVL